MSANNCGNCGIRGLERGKSTYKKRERKREEFVVGENKMSGVKAKAVGGEREHVVIWIGRGCGKPGLQWNKGSIALEKESVLPYNRTSNTCIIRG